MDEADGNSPFWGWGKAGKNARKNAVLLPPRVSAEVILLRSGQGVGLFLPRSLRCHGLQRGHQKFKNLFSETLTESFRVKMLFCSKEMYANI
jgi:hypothetical protein